MLKKLLLLPLQVAVESGMKKPTSGGALNILLQPSPQPVGHTSPTSFKVEFRTKGSDIVQPHIDYDLIIKGNSGKQVFRSLTTSRPTRQTTSYSRRYCNYTLYIPRTWRSIQLVFLYMEYFLTLLDLNLQILQLK